MKMIMLALTLLAGPIGEPPNHSPSSSPAPTAVEGRYDADGTPLYLVADGEQLSAVIGDSVYPLTRDDQGQLRNVAGARVEFELDSAGRPIAASDGSGRYRYASEEVPERVRARLRPLPRGVLWTYSTPSPAEPDLAVGDAAEAGLPHAALEALVARIADDPDWTGVHSLLVYRHGRLVMEAYFYGYAADEPHDLRSATKSVHGALAGIAVGRGWLATDMRIWSRLGDLYGVSPASPADGVTLAQAMNMQTGFACDDFDDASPARELIMMQSSDWTRFLLEAPGAPVEAGRGHYCSAAPVAVGRLIERVTGEALPDLAQRELFGPIGIDQSRYRWDFRDAWLGPSHVAGLHMTPRDMLRFGRLYLSDGVWNGQRILPEGWVDASFSGEVAVGSWRRYSRFWWTISVTDELLGPPQTFTVHAAMGNGGQRIAVLPEQDAVIVLTGGNYNDQTPTDRIIAYLTRLMAGDTRERR